MSKAALSYQHIYQTVFRPAANEPQATPGQYRFLRSLVTIQAYLIVGLLVMAVLASILFAPQNYYHLVVNNRAKLPEKLINLTPMTTPNLTHTAIINLCMNIATEVLTFGFHNADERLLHARRLFTPEAWQRFAKAYLDKGKLDVIKSNQQILTTIATDGAVITKEGYLETGDYQWVVQVPIITTYQAGKRIRPQPRILELTLLKQPTTKHIEGVAIDGWLER